MTLDVLKVLPMLGLLGCVSDFSPDPYNGTTTQGERTGSAKDAGKAASRDASSVTRDAEIDPPSNDDPPAQTADATSSEQPKSGCDLTGRWIMTERSMSNGAGAKQLTNTWFYVELSQDGDQTTMVNTLMCGGKTTGLSPIIVTMDDSKAWPAYMEHAQYDGRKGRSAESGSGCSVSFEKRAFVRGATPAAYDDLSQQLPTAEQEASDTVPGWEDWDNDGSPGVTMKISGTIQGTLSVVARTWTQATGSIAANAATFTLPLNWGQDRSNLAYDGSPLLTAQAAKDSDASQHVVELTRLSDDQANGDHAAKCQAIRELAATLTPNAMKP
jgi:hypothetical protein